MTEKNLENYAAAHDDYISHFYLSAKGYYPPPGDYSFKEINWAALIAWALAIGASIISPEDGPLSIAQLNAIITAIFVYAVVQRFIYANEEMIATS